MAAVAPGAGTGAAVGDGFRPTLAAMLPAASACALAASEPTAATYAVTGTVKYVNWANAGTAANTGLGFRPVRSDVYTVDNPEVTSRLAQYSHLARPVVGRAAEAAAGAGALRTTTICGENGCAAHAADTKKGRPPAATRAASMAAAVVYGCRSFCAPLHTHTHKARVKSDDDTHSEVQECTW